MAVQFLLDCGNSRGLNVEVLLTFLQCHLAGERLWYHLGVFSYIVSQKIMALTMVRTLAALPLVELDQASRSYIERRGVRIGIVCLLLGKSRMTRTGNTSATSSLRLPLLVRSTTHGIIWYSHGIRRLPNVRY